jgi:3-dehydroquinate synthetase
MATGKTMAGRLAAEMLGLPFFDVDSVIEARAGMPVSEIFARFGEARFRNLERSAMTDAASVSGAVVATGGGAVGDPATFGDLTDGAVAAVLTCRPDELMQRLGEGIARPLLQADSPSRVRELLRERAAAYDSAGEALDTTGLTVEEVAAELANRYGGIVEAGRPVRIPVHVPDRPYEIVLGPGAMDGLGENVERLLPARRAALAVDGETDRTYSDRVSVALERAGLMVAAHIVLPGGEATKRVEVVADLWSRFRKAGLEPGDVAVAVGGGATLDAVGFAAATYARGLPLVTVPTTLLAMVDAALGGKVGIDHAGVKNLVGSFHHPRLVVADPIALDSLPPRALRAGFGEVVKALLLASPLALEGLETGGPDIAGHVVWLAEQAVRIKAGYVAADPWDRGLRHALNLGHTFAHAIEAATQYEVPHGEAVAMGLVAATRLGAEIGVTPQALSDRLRRVLARLDLPADPPSDLDPERLLEAMNVDKKRRAGRAVLVVPSDGGSTLVEGVRPRMVLDALLPPGAGRPAW